MSKLAIVGCEASGKTVFMSALADLYREALVPENAAANHFQRFAARQLRSLRQWPPATNPGKAMELQFSMRREGETIASFSLLEFGGETFRAAFRGTDETPEHEEAVKALLDYLSGADFIVVLVSLKELLRDPGSVGMDDFERDSESLWVTRGLIEFARKRLDAPHIVIGLTQADLHREELAAAASPAALLAERWPSVAAVASDVTVVAVASVSATDEEGRPAQDFTTDGVLTIMREFTRKQYGDAATLIAELKAAKAELDGLKFPESPGYFANKMRQFATKLSALDSINALSGYPYAREIEEFRTTLMRYRDLERLMPKPVEPPKKSAKSYRRPFMLLSILAVIAGVCVYFRPSLTNDVWNGYATPMAKRITPDALRRPEPTKSAMKIVTNQVTVTREIPVTNQVTVTHIVPVTNQVTVTRIVPVTNQVIVTREVVVTNSVPLVLPKAPEIKTQALTIPPPAPAPNTTQQKGAEAPYRIWRDYKGKAIEARWKSTTADGQYIILQTPSGRLFNAVVHKLSEEDRKFIAESLRTANGGGGN